MSFSYRIAHLERCARRHSDEVLRRLRGDRCHGRDAGGQLTGDVDRGAHLGAQLREPDAVRLVGVDLLAGQQHAGGMAGPDRPGEELGRAGATVPAPADLARSEARRRLGRRVRRRRRRAPARRRCSNRTAQRRPACGRARGRTRSPCRRPCGCGTASWCRTASRSPMSLPAQKALPCSPRAPVSTTARTASSSVASRHASLNWPSIATRHRVRACPDGRW